LQAFGLSKPESLQSQKPLDPEMRLSLNGLPGSSRTTDYRHIEAMVEFIRQDGLTVEYATTS
jgi:hypothetical protein